MAQMRGSSVDMLAAEFDGVALGDARLDERLTRIVSLVATAPADSFPDQMASVADREALYRFLANPKVTMERLLSGHVQQTHERLRGQSTVRIVHDTSSFNFDGEREGLGILSRGQNGFQGHLALAIAPDETREPLGVLGVRPFIHKNTLANRGRTKSEKRRIARGVPRNQKESSRWEKLAIDVSAKLPEGVRAIHVMDQEADDYALFAALRQANLGFVVRACVDKLTGSDRVRASDVLAKMPGKIFRTVPLTRRPKGLRAHPSRAERTADLKVRWGRITLRRTKLLQVDADEVSLWAVHVFEPKPPEGEEAIQWMLFTSEPVETLEQATAVVDHYRARWIVEEYFKALKTGCAFEKRQLTTYSGLTRALAIFVPMAWHLLVLRHLGRAPENRSARSVFDREQIVLLRALLKQRHYKFPKNPTVRDAMLAVAALGGHIKNNGDPGWLVLGRGFTRFVEAEAVWKLAREM